jgi:Protein of unknown function (DUF3352)
MRIAMRSALSRAILGGAACVGLLLAPAPGRAAGQDEKALPANTFVYFKIDNAAKLRKEFSASQFGRMIADPAMDPLKADIMGKLEESSNKLKEAVGLSLNEIIELPHGAITLAFISREPGPGKPAVAVLISADAGENAEKMASVLAKGTKEAEAKASAKVATETFKGMKLTIVRKSDDDKEPVVWVKSGSVFYLASDVDTLKERITNDSGRADSLASNENYQAVMKGLGDSPQVCAYIDVSQALKLAIASNPGGNVAQMEAQLQLVGINGFKGAGASFSFNKGDYDQVMKVFFYSPGPAQGILKILSMPPIDLKPPAWVPASVLGYQAFSMDFDTAWKAISDLAEQFGGGAAIEQVQRVVGPNGDFDFKKDVFAPLGNRITMISDLKKPITDKSRRSLFALALDDEKAIQGTFNKIIDLTKATPKKRDFQGTTIYDFEVPTLPAGAKIDIQGPISVAIAKGNLFVATEPTFLEQVLRSGAPALADSPDFQAVAKKLPEKNSVLAFDRTEEQFKALYDMVKNGGLQKALDQANAGNGKDVKNPIDPKKVPDFSIFAKYLGQGGSFGIMDEQGMTITSFILRKAAP